MARPRKAEEDKRAYRTTVWANKEEHLLMQTRARATGLSLSTYLRNLGCSYPIKSRADQYLLSLLVSSKNELSKQGGLLKLYLSKTDRKENLGSKTPEDIDYILESMEQKQNHLISIAESIAEQVLRETKDQK